jgi:hypothetical protein
LLLIYVLTNWVANSAGPECKAVLQETTKLIETKLATNGKALRAIFNAKLVVDGDFLYYMADAAATAVIHMIVAIFLMHCNSLY